jgi:hypothetical protein
MKSFQFVLGLLAASAATAQQYTISTVAGTGLVQGYFGDGAAATGAQLDFPLRVAVDSSNNFYIADYLTWVVRKVTAAGIISTMAPVSRRNSPTSTGSPSMPAGAFSSPIPPTAASAR